MTGNSSLEASSVLDAIRPLVPEIQAQAAEFERARALPSDLNEKLRKAGLFRMLIPRKFGGEELHTIQVSRVLEELGKADASAGWTGVIGFGFNVCFGRFPRELMQRLFGESPDVLARGVSAPKGIAVPTKGGYTVKGRWQLASGSYDYRWVMGGCMIVDDGKPRIGANGLPEMRVVLVPREKAQFLDTWHAIGLRGSSSHDFVLDEQFVPDLHVADLYRGAPSFDTAIHRLPYYILTAPTHASVTIGIAAGALDDLANLAKTKRPAFGMGKLLADDPVFAHQLGALRVRLDGLRAALDASLLECWNIAEEGQPISPLPASRATSMAAYIQRECQHIVDDVFSLAGSSACYESSPIQRRWRDIRVIIQHTAASTSPYGQIGKLLAGGERAPSVVSD